MRSAIYAFVWVRLALVVSTSLLASCSRDDRAEDIKLCMADVENKVPNSELLYLRSAASVEERHDNVGVGIAECMASKGYRHDSGAMADERCVDDVDYNSYCYRRGN